MPTDDGLPAGKSIKTLVATITRRTLYPTKCRNLLGVASVCWRLALRGGGNRGSNPDVIGAAMAR
jgi:hypothetical protein